MARRKPLNKGEKILLIVMIILLAVGGFVVFWTYYSNIDPVVFIPTPVMPNPNARDDYLAAAKARVSSISTGKGASLEIDDIAAWIQNGRITRPKWSGAPPPKLADMHRLMQLNAPAIARLHQSFTHEYREPPQRSRDITGKSVEMRQLERILQADADLQCAEGNWDGGAERYLDILRLGEDIGHGAPLIGMLVGTSLQALGRQEAWPTLDHISSVEARHAARRLEEITARHVPYAEVLQEEKWATQAMMMEAFHGSNWRGFHSYLEGDAYDHPDTLSSIRALFCTKQMVMQNYTEYMDALIANAKKPYPAVTARPPRPQDPINARFLSCYDYAWIRDYVARTQNDLLMVSFALRAYHADHGQYPANLKALVPAYLQAVPADPFATNATLCYKLTGKSYLLYSIGPDAVDGGGSPSPDGQINPKTKRYAVVFFDSTGDIVAGVNIK